VNRSRQRDEERNGEGQRQPAARRIASATVTTASTGREPSPPICSGPAFFIERSKREMIAENIAADLVHARQRWSRRITSAASS
jgi:hypothetical protein